MRLWHERLISELPRQQLLGQHRECCALRGLGWNKKHSTVDYVFLYSPYKLYQYHMKIINEMKVRGYRNNPLWEDPTYRGKASTPFRKEEVMVIEASNPIYPEHNIVYLKECLYNLGAKGIRLSSETSQTN